MAKIIDIKIPDYKIEKELGKGGMATVYLATHNRLHRKVALKVMSSETASVETFQKSFINEGRTVALLEHPNIVKIHDINAQGNHVYMSTEVLSGGTLKERLAKEKLSIANALNIIDEMADALNYAHQKSYIHRDIKPANIMFREDDSAVLTDFGIAKIQGQMGEMTRVGYISGTPYYMSPEQATGQKNIDQRTDIYSLGVVFYEIITGEKPFMADNTVAIIYGHVHNPIPKLKGENSIFQPVLDKALAKKPEDRFNNVKDFSLALQKCSQAEGETIFIPIPDKPKKKSTLSWVLPTVIATSVVGFGGYYYASQPNSATQTTSTASINNETSTTKIMPTSEPTSVSEKNHTSNEKLNTPSEDNQPAKQTLNQDISNIEELIKNQKNDVAEKAINEILINSLITEQQKNKLELILADLQQEKALEEKRQRQKKLKDSVEEAHLLFESGKLEEAQDILNDSLQAPEVKEDLKKQAQTLLSKIKHTLKIKSDLTKLSAITITSSRTQAKIKKKPFPKLTITLNSKAYLHCVYQSPAPEDQKMLQLYPSPPILIKGYKLPKTYRKYKKITKITFPISEELTGIANIYCFTTNKEIKQTYTSLFTTDRNGFPYTKKEISIKSIEKSISKATQSIYKKASFSLEFKP